MSQCVETLKEWTGTSNVSILFDSTVDEFTDDSLFQRVANKPDIAIVGFTTDGDVFGGYFHVRVTAQDEMVHDPDHFIFTFECHGRCATPQRFLVKAEQKDDAKVRFFKDDSGGWFVDFGLLNFFVVGFGNEKSDTFCFNPSIAYDGIEDSTLTGTNTNPYSSKRHHCFRLLGLWLQ